MLVNVLNFSGHSVKIAIAENRKISDEICSSLEAFYGNYFITKNGRTRQNLYSYFVLMNIIKDNFKHFEAPVVINCTGSGKPYINNSNIEFNISHSGSLCAVAVSDIPVGIDIQIIKPAKPETVKYACSQRECEIIYASSDFDRAFTRFWTFKESYLKAVGCGLRVKLNLCEFDIDGNIIGNDDKYKTMPIEMHEFTGYCCAITAGIK